jgi:hypothetical protein
MASKSMILAMDILEDTGVANEKWVVVTGEQ